MERGRNTTKFGQPFRASIIEAVWEKAQAVVGSNPDKFRKDACGAWMVKSSFGKNIQFGWEIDHILSISNGGKDDLQNLQPPREAISDLVTRAGFPAVVLAPVSFEQIYMERRKQQADSGPGVAAAN